MAPPRKRITKLGQHLRAARASLSLDQKAFASLVHVSDRTLSRWENGARPTAAEAKRVLDACENLEPDLYNELAVALGFELEDDPPPQASAVTAAAHAPVAVSPSPIDSASRSPAELRASLDAIIYAAAEERDVLPRHLRAFGVELLQGAERLGLSAKEAAHLVAVPARAKTKKEGEAGSGE